MKNTKIEQGLLCIDIFTKYALVVPIKSKQEDAIAAGILERMHNTGKTPEVIYTDDEGELHKPSIQPKLKEHNITHSIARNHDLQKVY